jgi:hypothetical protein
MREILLSLWKFAEAVWPFAKTVSGAVAAILTFSYAASRLMFDLLDRLRSRWDGKVQEFLDSNVTKSIHMPTGGQLQKGNPKSVAEIASSTGFSEKRVLASLKRLKLKRLVTSDSPGSWKANVPHLTSD